ncbi:MAG: hypothetical protein M3322_09350 [Actinomycetota bacterium]|nr:hypothetical protein [Actinomycetota bacterium]
MQRRPNRAPRIGGRIRTAAQDVAGRRRLVVRVRLRVCDDSPGVLSAQVSQRRALLGKIVARGTFERRLPSLEGECSSYRFAWRTSPRFAGGATFVVEVRVRDADGAWSRELGAVRGAGR